MLINKELFAAVLSAGDRILEIYESGDFTVTDKSDSSPLTLADKESHRILESYLKSTGYPVLSEEGRSIVYSERKKWERYWLVDPLDGTKEFIRKNGDFTVNVALISEGRPIAGIVYVPVSDTLYYASEGAGSFILDNASADRTLSGAARIHAVLPKKDMTIVASRSHMNDETQAFIESQAGAGYNISTFSRGSSLKLCMVAEGKAHVYPRFGPTMEWDTAAAHAVCREAGAVVLDNVTGRELVYNKKNLLNPHFIVFPEKWSGINAK